MLAHLALFAAPSIFGSAVDTAPVAEMPRTLVETVVQATPTHFSAWNPSSAPQLFLFGTLDGRHVESRVVLPGSSLELNFPSAFPTALAFEVLSRTEGTLHGSGPIALDAYRSQGFLAVWARVEGTRSSAWLTDPSALGRMSIRSLLPGRTAGMLGPAPEPGHRPLLSPARLPAITPSDGPEGDSPPVLEDDLLPPV